MTARDWWIARPHRREIRERLYRRRVELELSRQQVAARCGLSMRIIQQYERGVYIPRADKLAVLALALETTTDFIVGLSDFHA